MTHISCSPGVGPIIPDKCQVKLDRRILPSKTNQDIIEECKTLTAFLKEAHPDTTISSEIIMEPVLTYTGEQRYIPQFFPGWVLPEGTAVVNCAQQALKGILGEIPDLITWRFGTDGSYTAGIREIPTIGFGPSQEAQAHMPNEHVPVENVLKAFDGYVVLAESLTNLKNSHKTKKPT